jgi:hypothetical protein
MITLNGRNFENTDELFHYANAMNLNISDIEKVKFEKYVKWQKMGRLLQIPTPLAVLDIRVKNPNEVEHGQLKISDSWVRNQYTWQQQNMALADFTSVTFGTGLFSMKNTSGTIKSANCARYSESPETLNGYYAAANDATRGIIIGTSTTAESLDHFTLQTPIVNGTEAGQMSYNACGVTKVWSSPTWTAEWVRIINNNSGGTITVNECGLYLYAFDYYSWPSTYIYRKYMTNRDKLLAGEAILDAGQLTVTYNIVITYP